MIRLPDLIRKYAFQRPDKTVIHFEGRDISWATFNDRLHRMAQVLQGFGVKPGDRVAYLGMNSNWIVEMYYVPSLIGAISVPMNFRLSEDEQVGVLDDCAPEILIVDRHFQPRAAALMARCPSLKTLIFADWDRPSDDLPADTLHYEELIAQTAPVANDTFDGVASSSDETLIIFYTSGTTGLPKGVMLSHSNMLSNSAGTGAIYGYLDTDVLLLSGPLFHLGTGSRVFTSVLYGTRMVVQPKFDVIEMMDLIENQSVTTMTLVPTMLQMILDHPRFNDFDFSSLRCLSYGSAPMPEALIKRVIDTIPDITFCQGYGMTETSPVLSSLSPADHQEVDGKIPKLASIGRPVNYGDLRIVDENDKPLAEGEIGEIIIRGPQVMNGYWNRPEETAHAMRGGFYHTGDSGYLDQDGYLFLAGRTKEMMITGGENVYPIEVESCLSLHPAVGSVGVLGLPHEKWGEVVFAAVSLKNEKTVTNAELVIFCREKIAHYKVPKSIKIWEGDLPLAATNKIDKKLIKEMAIKEGLDNV